MVVAERPSTKATLVPPKPSELEIVSLSGCETGRNTVGISRRAGSSGSAFTDGASHPPRERSSGNHLHCVEGLTVGILPEVVDLNDRRMLQPRGDQGFADEARFGIRAPRRSSLIATRRSSRR